MPGVAHTGSGSFPAGSPRLPDGIACRLWAGEVEDVALFGVGWILYVVFWNRPALLTPTAVSWISRRTPPTNRGAMYSPSPSDSPALGSTYSSGGPNGRRDL